MPRQIVLSRVPVDLSIVEFNLDAGEDVFLTYSWERREGPEIWRTGKGPPYMELIGGEARQTTAHAFGLRLGTWLIQEDLRRDERAEAQKALAQARQDKRPKQDVDVLERTLRELEPGGIRAHDAVFGGLYPDYEIVGQQGCGDLTMNAWNVAYFNSDLGQDTEHGGRPPTLVCLPSEQTQFRTYSCLVKWKGSEVGLGRLTIEEVQFRRTSEVNETNEMVSVRYGETWLPRADRIEFAVSNQQVIRNGEIVPIVTSCHQFGDLRHLLQMPNLNPADALYTGEPPNSGGKYLPRQYFNTDQFGDIWFGEEALLKDTSQNLFRAALAGPVFLEPPSGATVERLHGAFNRAGYQEARSATEPLLPGHWRSVRHTPQETVVDVYFKRNTYGWTMVGLSPDNRRILCLACTGKPGVTGYHLEQAAEILLRAGAWNALLMDEGADVFQRLRRDDGQMADTVPRLRQRVRATFIFARPSHGQGCAMRAPEIDEDGGTPLDCTPRGTADHRNRKLPPRDQRGEGSCVGFAGAAAREYLLADPELLSPRFLYHWCKQQDGQRDVEGTYLRAAEQVLIEKGICREATWPYDPSRRTAPQAAETDALPFRTAGFVNLYASDTPAMLRNIKCWLDRHGPFLAAVWIYQGWYRAPAKPHGTILLPAEMEVRIGGHAICVVGYNDKQSQFIFKNSWGTGWGDKGYGYLPYDYVKAYCLEAWGLRSAATGNRPGPSPGEGSSHNAST